MAQADGPGVNPQPRDRRQGSARTGWPAISVLTRPARGWDVARSIAITVGLVAVAAGIGWILPHRKFPVAVPAALFLTAVSISSALAGLWAGVLASVMGFVAIDLLFIPPLYVFALKGPDDVALAGVFLLTAFSVSWVLARLRETRSSAEREWRRVSAVAAITERLAEAVSIESLGLALVDEVRLSLGAVAAGVFLLDDAGAELDLLAAKGYPEDIVEAWSRFSVDTRVPAAEAVRDRRAVLLGSMAERAAHHGLSRLRMGAGSLAALPILLNDEVLGSITLSLPDDHGFPQEDTQLLQLVALQFAQAFDRVRLEEDERRNRERAEFLAEASGVLASSLDVAGTLDQVARLAVPRFADWAAVDLLTEDGQIELVAVAHRDPEKVSWAWELRKRLPPSLGDGTGIGEVMRTGEPQFDPDHSPQQALAQVNDPAQLEVVERLAPRSVILSPLIAREKVLGALTLIYSESGRRYTREDLQLANDLARRAAMAIDNAFLHREQLDARSALESAEARLRVLAEASRALGTTLELDATLKKVADLAVDHLADFVVIYLARDGRLESAAVAHVDPARLPLLERIQEAYEPWRSHVMRAFRSRTVQVIEEIDTARFNGLLGAEVGPMVEDVGVSSGVALPLIISDRAVGVLALAWASSRDVSDSDLQMAEELSRRMARAIENARLFERERTTRATLERITRRQRLVSHVSEILAYVHEYPTVFERLARTIVDEVADLCLIDVLDVTGGVDRVAAAHADPSKQPLADRLRTEYVPRLDLDHPVARVIRSGLPESLGEMSSDFIRRTTRDEEHLKLVDELGFQSFICVPLWARGRILGTITFISCDPSRRYGADDLSLATDIARQAAVRIDNVRLFHERDHVARSLQRTLLPASLPDISGYEFATIYEPWREGMDVGGDFYDVFIRPDGSFGVVIGDVCGHGPEAAAVMGIARQTVRIAGMSETRPSAILSVVNDALLRGSFERFVTVCDIRVLPHPDSTHLTVCAAGHPLPLLVRADGDVETIGQHGTLLGVFEEPVLTDVSVDMQPGDTLVLYTDGLLEWPSEEDVGAAFRQLLSSVARCDAEEVARRIEEWWQGGSGGRARDDAAALVLRSLEGDE